MGQFSLPLYMPAYPVSPLSTGCSCSAAARRSRSLSSSRDASEQSLQGEGWGRGSAGDEAEEVLQNWGEKQNLVWSYNWQQWPVYLPPISPAGLSCNRKAVTIMGHKMRVDTKGTAEILDPCN